jgi:hypothetical protein
MSTINNPKILICVIPLIAVIFVSYLVYSNMQLNVKNESFYNLETDEKNITNIENIHPSEFSYRGVGEYNGVFSKGNLNITGPIGGSNTTFIS